jgi:hypothetical protein
MPSPADRRALLRQLYGFDFPEDLYRFWDFARRLRPLEPLRALSEALGITLVGPFDVLAGRCDRRRPRLSMLLHWRYHDDPPEFFTVFAGDTDGLHWGYYCDDPPGGPVCVASYYARDAFEFSADGDSLFEAARLHLEYRYRDDLDYMEDEPDEEEEYREDMARLDVLRQALSAHVAGRPEVGEAYTDRYAGTAARNALVIAETPEGMGVVAPPETYRPLSRKGKRYLAYLRRTDDPADVVEEARQALRDGFPATALKVGKDLWAVGGERRTAYACELLDAAYQALGRERLREALRVHRAHRDLPSVDVFEDEGDGNEHA